MSTITAQDGTGAATTPELVDGFAADAESGNVIHQLIAPGQIAVTLVGDLPRTGTLRLLYADAAAAESARVLLGRPTSFVFADVEVPQAGMTFVRSGRLGNVLEDQTRALWILEVGFQEITP